MIYALKLKLQARIMLALPSPSVENFLKELDNSSCVLTRSKELNELSVMYKSHPSINI